MILSHTAGKGRGAVEGRLGRLGLPTYFGWVGSNRPFVSYAYLVYFLCLPVLFHYWNKQMDLLLFVLHSFVPETLERRFRL